MFSLICALRVAPDKVIEHRVKREFRSIEEARATAESEKLAIAYRVFDKTGFRVYTKKLAERG
jgi:hypothetical protein